MNFGDIVPLYSTLWYSLPSEQSEHIIYII